MESEMPSLQAQKPQQPSTSLARYLGGLTKERSFMIKKGRTTKTEAWYLVEYLNEHRRAVYDDQGNLVKRGGSYRVYAKNIGTVRADHTVEFREAFLEEHPKLRGQTVYAYKHKLYTYPQYLKAVRESNKNKPVEEEAQVRLPGDSHTRVFGPGLVAFSEIKKLSYLSALQEVFGTALTKLYISLIQYMTITGGAAFDGYHNYAKKNILFGCQRWDSKDISEGLKKLTPSKIHQFWMALNRITYRPGEMLGICFDSTSISTYAKIPEAAWGKNKDGDILPQVNLLCAVLRKSGRITYSETYEGSVPDIRAFQHNIKNLTNGVVDPNKVILICDRGYKSTSNLDYANRLGMHFVMAVRTSEKDVYQAVEKIHADLKLNKKYMNGKTQLMESPLFEENYSFVDEAGITHQRKVYYHVYYDQERAKQERFDIWDLCAAFENKGNKPLDKTIYEKVKPLLKRENGHEVLDDVKVDRAHDMAGVFVLCTSFKGTSAEVYDYYKDRNNVEVFIDHLKNGVDARRMRHQAETYQGFLFLATLAAGIRMDLCRLKNATKEPSISLNQLFKSLESLEVTELNGQQEVSLVPAKIQRLLNKMGIYLDKEASVNLNINLPYQPLE